MASREMILGSTVTDSPSFTVTFVASAVKGFRNSLDRR